MPYATKQDIIDQYGENELIISADHDLDGIADADVVDRALSGASDEIDTYLVGRYPLPLATVPPILKPLCIDIALYKMSTGTAVTDEKRRRYDDAVKLLTKIAEGKLTFGLEKPPAGASGAVFTGPERQFTRDKLSGY